MELHGRKQIFTNEEITARNVVQVLNKAIRTHATNRSSIDYLMKYIKGYQPVLDRVKVYNKEICNRIVVNIANQIVTFKTAEFAGEPIQYVSRGTKKSVPKKVDKLNSLMLAEEKQSKDMELAYWMFTAGVGYRLVLRDKAEEVAKGDLFDEAPFEVYVCDPRNTFVIRMNDVTKRVVAGVNYVYLTDTKIRYHVYTADEMFVLEGSATSAGKVTDHTKYNFGAVPILEYPCNSIYMSPIEVVIDLLDAISLVQSNRLDGIEQFIQAIMVFEGVDATREQIMEMRDLGAIKIPPSSDGKSSKVYYLNEQLDQSQTQVLMDDMYQTVCQIVGMPRQGNANTSDSSNNGAMIVKNGWWDAEARAQETEGMWRKAETEFLKIVMKICEEANVLSGLSVLDVEPKFGRRAYEDLLVKTQSFSTLIGAEVPPIQAFKFSKISKDPESDALLYEQYQEQKAAELDAVGGASIGTGEEVTSYDDEGETGLSDDDYTKGSSATGSGHPQGVMATCPVCHRTFRKKTNNQKYDRAECRRKAAKLEGKAL